MTEIKARVRKWGNSFGIIIPASIMEKHGISEGEEISALVMPKINVLKKMFGKMKFKQSTDEIMREIDRELYNE